MENKPFDLKVMEFKNSLVQQINNSGLPITVLSMILHEITNAVDIEQQKTISNLLVQQNKDDNKT